MVGLVLLVADPDEGGGGVLDLELRGCGVETAWCRTGAEVLVEYGRLRPDALLLAPRLDVVDTPVVVRTLRDAAATQPVLVGAGQGSLELVGPALLAGATGAVSRPYRADEVVGRLGNEVHARAAAVTLVYGPIELDPAAHRVRIGPQVWESPPLKEFLLLRLLMTHADRVVSPEQIREALWGAGDAGPSSNAVAVHVGRLRARLAAVAELRTVRGRGYRLTV